MRFPKPDFIWTPHRSFYWEPSTHLQALILQTTSLHWIETDVVFSSNLGSLECALPLDHLLGQIQVFHSAFENVVGIH